MLCFSWPGKPGCFIFLFKRFAQQQIEFSIRGIRRDDQKCKLLEGQIDQQQIQFCYQARALRALGLLLADGAPTVGRGKTF